MATNPSPNPLTDALQLVQTNSVRGFWGIFGRSVKFEDGFSLELFRGGTHLGSILSSQTQLVTQMKQRFQELGAKDGDTLYRVNLGPKMQPIQGKVRTQDGYTREYRLTAELQVLDSSQFIKFYRQGADPVNLVILGVQEAIQEYASRTIYEKMHAASVGTQATYAFDREPDNLRAGIKINRAYQSSLGMDTAYRPINLSPLLPVSGKLTTLEGYIRPYEVTVELEIIEPVLHRQLSLEGADPLNLAKVAIEGEIQRAARQQNYEKLSELHLQNVVAHAFDNLPSRITGGMKIVRAHRFSLGSDPEYIDLGHRTLNLAGKLATVDQYEREYEVTVELEISNTEEFVRLTRQKNDPLDLARQVIEGAIYRAAHGKTHNELPDVDLDKAARDAFREAPGGAVGGLKIIRAHKVFLRVDPRIQDQANIKHETDVEITRVQEQSRVDRLQAEIAFVDATVSEKQQLALTIQGQERERIEHLFEIWKDATTQAHRRGEALSEWIYREWIESRSEDLRAGGDVQAIVRELGSLEEHFQQAAQRRLNHSQAQANPALPDASNHTDNGENQAEQNPTHPFSGRTQTDTVHPTGLRQANTPSSSQELAGQQISFEQLGLTLREVSLSAKERENLDIGQDRAFQVWKVKPGSLAQDAGFRKADILLEVDGQEASTAKAVRAVFEDVQPGKELKVVVLRGDRFFMLKLALAQPDADNDADVEECQDPSEA